MRRLAQHAALNAAANAAASASQWLLVVMFAHLYGKDTLGAYGLTLAVVSPLFLLGGLNLRALASSLPESAYAPRQLLQLQAWGVTVAALASVVAGAFLLRDHGFAYTGLLVAVVVAKVVDTLAEGRYGFLQRQHRTGPIARRKFARAVLTVATFAVLAHWARLPPALAMAGVFAGSAALYLLGERAATAKLADHTAPNAAARVLPLALLSGAAAAVDALVIAIPRLELGNGVDLASVALFTALIQIPMIGAVIVSGIGHTMISRLRTARACSDYLRMLASAQGSVAFLGLAGAAVAGLWGDRLMPLVYGREFSHTGGQLAIVMWGGLAWYLASMNGIALQARGRYRAHLVTICAAAVAAGVAMALQTPGVLAGVNAYVAAMVTRLAVSTAALLEVFIHHDGWQD
ncbi:Uncharacterised protein [Bordetella ansorpii]|uniref:Polysaccharide biosynthesis protein n=1 Tax=Bordetella ansorpii TaxID=288768 RepID=A0A157SUX4_9BORD|nr:hypothetical protein [Bordetella ansorpii]SAI73873.1 Uncharacterised protein [Bordetella ansorpii]